MTELAPLALGIALLVTIVMIVKAVVDNKTRRHLIEKGIVDDKLKSLLEENPEFHILSVLKWAFVLIGIGLAVLVGLMAAHAREYMLGLMFLFTGIGLVLYYLIARSAVRKR